MIPSVIVLGLLCGLVPRYRWWAIPVIGLSWSALLLVWGDPSGTQTEMLVAGFLFGAANAAVGVFIGLVLWKLGHAISGSLRHSTSGEAPSRRGDH